MTFTVVSQHSPTAQVALTCNLHVAGLQHGLSQCSGRPQSHSSPSSTNIFPHSGLSNKLVKKKRII